MKEQDRSQYGEGYRPRVSRSQVLGKVKDAVGKSTARDQMIRELDEVKNGIHVAGEYHKAGVPQSAFVYLAEAVEKLAHLVEALL